MGFLNNILGIQKNTIPTEEINNKSTPQYLAYVTYLLTSDGDVHVKTEWASEKDSMPYIYANLLHQIGQGNMYGCTLETLMSYAVNNIKSQKFLVDVFEELKKLRDEVEGEPLISPTKALSVGPSQKKEEKE